MTTNAYRDENNVPTLIASSSTDGKSPVRLYADPTSHRLLIDNAGTNSVTVGTTTISGGTTTRILYDNAGVLGEYTLTGTGTVVAMQTSPAFTTPSLGVATATSINGNTFTTGTYTLTGQAGKTLTFNGSITLTGTDAQTYTFPTTSATIARTDAANTFTGTQTFSSTITGSVNGNAATVTTNANLTGAVTSVGNAASLGSFSSANLSGALTDETGTGVSVFNTKPTFIGTINTIVAVAALALDGSLGSIFTKTIGSPSTFTQSNFSTGQCFLLKITGAFTPTWFSGITWITSGGTAPTQAAITTYGFVCTGSNTFDGYVVGTQ